MAQRQREEERETSVEKIMSVRNKIDSRFACVAHIVCTNVQRYDMMSEMPFILIYYFSISRYMSFFTRSISISLPFLLSNPSIRFYFRPIRTNALLLRGDTILLKNFQSKNFFPLEKYYFPFVH